MATFRVATGDRIIDPMIALTGWSMQHRIVVAGSKSVDMMIELHRRGFFQAAATGNCGRPAGQYDVALIDSQLRTLPDLETTLHWLAILAPMKSSSPGSLPRNLRQARAFVPHGRSATSSSSRRPCMSAAAQSRRWRRQNYPLQQAA